VRPATLQGNESGATPQGGGGEASACAAQGSWGGCTQGSGGDGASRVMSVGKQQNRTEQVAAISHPHVGVCSDLLRSSAGWRGIMTKSATAC